MKHLKIEKEALTKEKEAILHQAVIGREQLMAHNKALQDELTSTMNQLEKQQDRNETLETELVTHKKRLITLEREITESRNHYQSKL